MVNRFLTRESEQWYRARQETKFIVEKRVDPRIDCAFQIRNAFASLGWETLLDLHNVENHENGKAPYYPKLIREFYANIVDRDNADQLSIRSYLKGVNFEITENMISEVFNVSNEGLRFQTKQDEVIHDPDYDDGVAIRALRAHGDIIYRKKGRVTVRNTKRLNIRNRLLAYLLNFNVIPRASSFNELRHVDIYMLYRLTQGVENFPGLSLPAVIIKEILDAARHESKKKNLCFPLILSRLFEHIGIDLNGEHILRTKPSDCLDSTTLISMGYLWDRETSEWVLSSRLGGPGRSAPSEENPSIPSGEGPSHTAPSAESTTYTDTAPIPPPEHTPSTDPTVVSLLQELIGVSRRTVDEQVYIREQLAHLQESRHTPAPPPRPPMPYPPPYPQPSPYQDPQFSSYYQPHYRQFPSYSSPIPPPPGVSSSTYYAPPPFGPSYPPPQSSPYFSSMQSPYHYPSHPGPQYGDDFAGPSSSYHPDDLPPDA